jgi:hypothetical protein
MLEMESRGLIQAKFTTLALRSLESFFFFFKQSPVPPKSFLGNLFSCADSVNLGGRPCLSAECLKAFYLLAQVYGLE